MDTFEPAPDTERTMLERVKHNVMRRIAALADRHLTVPAGDDRWRPFLQGVQIKMLHEHEHEHEHEGAMSYLLRLAPGAVLPAHRHPLDEECVVLEGEVSIGDELAVGAGGFHLARAGTLHAPIASAPGALLYLRGAAPQADQLV